VQIVFFIIGFVTFLVGFGSLIAFTARRLGGNVPRRIHGSIEAVLIAGILLGVFGLFQPWSLAGYGIGFHLLLVSVLGFVLWSHVPPRLHA
jgi:hypothetical protein